MQKLICFSVLILLATSAISQPHRGISQFQTIQVDPFIWSLGGATVAYKGYAGAAQINPATIGANQTVQLSSTFDFDRGLKTTWLPNLSADLWYASPSIDVKINRLAFAYSFKKFDFSDLLPRINTPGVFSNPYDVSHKLAAAYDVTNQLTIGVALNVLNISVMRALAEDTDNRDVITYSFDFGLHYQREFEIPYVDLSTSVGWSLTDFGPRVDASLPTAISLTAHQPLSMAMRGGLGVVFDSKYQVLRLPALSLGLYGSFTKGLVYYDDQMEAAGPLKALFAGWKSIDISRSSIDSEEVEETRLNALQQMTGHAGLDLAIMKVLHVRWGSHFEHRLMGDRNYDVFGVGLDLYYLAFHYSNVLKGDDNPLADTKAWQIIARVPLNQSRGSLWAQIVEGLAE